MSCRADSPIKYSNVRSSKERLGSMQGPLNAADYNTDTAGKQFIATGLEGTAARFVHSAARLLAFALLCRAAVTSDQSDTDEPNCQRCLFALRTCAHAESLTRTRASHSGSHGMHVQCAVRMPPSHWAQSVYSRPQCAPLPLYLSIADQVQLNGFVFSEADESRKRCRPRLQR